MLKGNGSNDFYLIKGFGNQFYSLRNIEGVVKKTFNIPNPLAKNIEMNEDLQLELVKKNRLWGRLVWKAMKDTSGNIHLLMDYIEYTSNRFNQRVIVVVSPEGNVIKKYLSPIHILSISLLPSGGYAAVEMNSFDVFKLIE